MSEVASLNTPNPAGPNPEAELGAHVQESWFGTWFIGTDIWTNHVIRRALADLVWRMPQPRASYDTILDLGCGWGHSLPLLARRFSPKDLIAVDIDDRLLKRAADRTAKLGCSARFLHGNASRLDLPDGSVDLAFCHQTFHHLVEQEACLSELYRVLKPGGLLLFAESTRRYIHSLPIRLLFRHPMDVQRSAEEYVAMIRGAGFTVAPDAISYPYLWWSRPDLGILEHWFRIAPPADREETLINLVAVRP